MIEIESEKDIVFNKDKKIRKKNQKPNKHRTNTMEGVVEDDSSSDDSNLRIRGGEYKGARRN